MLSLSDNEFSVLNFLIRNFSEKLTIRNIAKRLNFSSAGVFNILKKLEKQNIVVGEKLGTGLFYSINFENRIAEHLASVVLLYYEGAVEKVNLEQLKEAKAAILEKDNLLIITDNITTTTMTIVGFKAVQKTEDEVIALLRKKDQAMLQVLKKGIVLFGEANVVDIIKNCISRF